jgi:WhiB family redox-sensing transcriptional regulator
MDWRDGAACRHRDPELFFPEGTVGPALLQADQAKRVCQSCPVRTSCLDFALRHGLGFGIWGGVTGEERRTLRGSRLRPSAIPCQSRSTG